MDWGRCLIIVPLQAYGLCGSSHSFRFMCLTKSTKWGGGTRLCARVTPGPSLPPSPEPRSDQSDCFSLAWPAPIRRPPPSRKPGSAVRLPAALAAPAGAWARSQGGARAAGARGTWREACAKGSAAVSRIRSVVLLTVSPLWLH